MEATAITKTAFHEAAHFLALWEAGHSPRMAIVSSGGGRVVFLGRNIFTWDESISFMCCMMAGPAAEHKLLGLPCEEAVIRSLDAFHIMKALSGYNHSDRKALTRQANNLTEQWLDKNWRRITRLAHHLQRRKRLSADEIKRDLPGLL